MKRALFNNNLNNNSKTIALRKKKKAIGMAKYLPSFSKEWKNILYSYNKNNLKNIPINSLNINKIIQSYFNLYFKNYKYTGSNKLILLKNRRKFVTRIYVSNAEIKHTNDKAIITLYTVNREKTKLREKYLQINKKVSKHLIERYFLEYINNIEKRYEKFEEEFSFVCSKNNNEDTFTIQSSGGGLSCGAFSELQVEEKCSSSYYNKVPSVRPCEATFTNSPEENLVGSSKNVIIATKKNFLDYKLKYLNKFINLNNLYLNKIWSAIISKSCKRSLKLLRKYDLMYSLNQYKFNKKKLLPILSKILKKIIRKKIEYNIINLKTIVYNTDLFTNVIALKLKNSKGRYEKNILKIIYNTYLPNNWIKPKKIRVKGQNCDFYLSKYKDLKIISNLKNKKLKKILGKRRSSTKEQIHNTIFKSIGYKNLGGIRIEVKGRLTKKYRADRSEYSLNWKGGLKNKDSSSRGLGSVLFRGKFNSNVSYTLTSSKRRIGAYAVKGWISGK